MTLWGFDLWAVVIGFARIGAIVMLMPGLGEAAVPTQIRLGFALLLALMLAPTGTPEPEGLADALGLIVSETVVGLALGAIARMMVDALGTAGQIFGLETGLSFAQTADPTMTGSGQTISVFLSLLGVALIFTTELHHLFLRGVAESYQLFAPGAPPPMGDFAELGMRAFSESFRVAFQIAAPVIVAGFVFRLGLGILGRLAPQIQVFFVAMPLNVLGGFVILVLGLSAGMMVWLDRVSAVASGRLG